MVPRQLLQTNIHLLLIVPMNLLFRQTMDVGRPSLLHIHEHHYCVYHCHRLPLVLILSRDIKDRAEMMFRDGVGSSAMTTLMAAEMHKPEAADLQTTI